jgi:hypothetical protein
MTRSKEMNAGVGRGADASCTQRHREARGAGKRVQKTLDGSHTARRDRNNASETRLARSEKERLAEFQLLMRGIREGVERVAAELRQDAAGWTADVARGEQERLAEFDLLMKGIREGVERVAAEVRQDAADWTADVARGEQERLAEFDLLMKEIKGEVGRVFAYTWDLVQGYDKEHREMTAEQRQDEADGEQARLAQFDLLMKEIKGELAGFCKYTLELLETGVERGKVTYV